MAGSDPDLLLAFYGDDFTGSTDALDALARAGVRTALFLEPPERDDLDAFEDVRAVGVAGASRSMTPAEMDETLPSAFEALDELDPPLVHYKVCSTFDSSPDVGSIGHAIDLAEPIFETPFVPLAVGVPPLERYVCFGHLFAADDEGEVHRIDRHPTMRDHPVTPMTESDLGRHLGEQTEKSSTVLDIRDLAGDSDEVDAAFDRVRSAGDDVLIFDTMEDDDLATVGRLLWERSRGQGRDDTPFVVGSSGVEYALTDHWRREGLLGNPGPGDDPEPVDRIAVISGSASPVTDRQIEAALDGEFRGVRLDTRALVGNDPEAAIEAAVSTAREILGAGESPILYAARGSNDPAIETTEERANELGVEAGRRLARRQGQVLRRLLDREELGRVCVAGGDTCGEIVPELTVYALTPAGPISPGAPLCRAHARDEAFDGLEVALKGGQLGSRDYFERVRAGSPEDT